MALSEESAETLSRPDGGPTSQPVAAIGDKTLRAPRAAGRKAPVKTRRIVNKRLLAISAAVVVVGGAFAAGWHRYQAKRVENVFLQRAEQLEQEENWASAAGYLSRYLQLHPEDIDARLRLIAVVEKSATNAGGQARLVSLLYQTLGVLPQREDLRLKLAEQLYKVGEYQAALVQAEKLAAAKDEKLQAGVARVKALSLAAEARPNDTESVAAAVKALEAASKLNPNDAELASLIAVAYREHPQQAASAADANHADEVMNRIVEANPDNAAIRLARYKYRRRFDPAKAQADLDAALALPDVGAEALLFDVESTLTSGDRKGLERARKSAEKVISMEPQSPRGYIALARLDVAAGNLEGAAETLRKGSAQQAVPSLDLEYFLAEALVDLRKYEEAAKAAKAYSDASKAVRHLMPAPQRLQVENLEHMLNGRLAIASGDNTKAADEFEAIVASLDDSALAGDSGRIAVRAYNYLATVQAQQGRADLAAANWSTAARLSPRFENAGLKAGVANALVGNYAAAIEQLKTYSKQPAANPEVWSALVQSQLQFELQRPEAERNWSDFVAALEQARVTVPNRWDWQLAEAVYAANQPNADARTTAIEKLRSIEKKFPDDLACQERLITTFMQFGANDDVTRLLGNYDQRQPNVARRASLRAAFLAATSHTAEAIQVLEAASAKAAAEDQPQLAVMQINLLMATRDFDKAQQAAAAAVKAYPRDARLLQLAIEVALQRNDLAAARELNERLIAVTSADGFEPRFYAARITIQDPAKRDAETLKALESQVEALYRERPKSYPALVLAGAYAELRENRPAAITAYQAAIEAGDNRSSTLERLVRLLYAEERFSDAANYLKRMKSSSSIEGQLESTAIFAAMKENRLQEARQLAKQAVDAGSKDPIHYLLLANLLYENGEKDAAEQSYRTALKQFPQDRRVWNALFRHFIISGQPERARQALQRFVDQVPMSDDVRLLALAQGYEQLGDTAAAEKTYREAVQKFPTNAAAHFQLGKLLAGTDAAAAREELQKSLAVAGPHTVEARRLLAALLAMSGGDANWAAAEAYLNSNDAATSMASQNDSERVRILLLTRKGKNRDERINNCKEARRRLDELITSEPDGPAAERDRILLASICEQEALLTGSLAPIQDAREAWQPIINSSKVTADQLASYVKLLIRQVKPKSAEKPADSADANARQLLADEARVQIAALEKLVANAADAQQKLLPLALQVSLLAAEGKQADGLKLLEAHAESQLAGAKTDADRAKVYLELGNLCTVAGAPTAAESWYRKLQEIAPTSFVLVVQSLMQQNKANEAAEACLAMAQAAPSSDVATILAQILTAEAIDSATEREALAVIRSALDSDRGNVNLLMSFAVQRTTRNDNTEAIRLFRRVVELQPKHVLALNNLATLLAEQPDELAAAQQYVERAIAVAGRRPELMDTLGTILLRSQKYPEAVAALEEAVAGVANDPRYYFHLAAAREGANDKAGAQSALQESLRLGLERAILTSGDRELLASLKKQLLTVNNGS